MMNDDFVEEYDALVIGGGIAGIESALTLADMGFNVLLVEKEPSIGGKMALLSKVFPTLDCASCISTPKMAAVYHHPNITLKVYSEVTEINKLGEGEFEAVIVEKPKYVDPQKCTACTLCEKACPVIVPDEYQFGLRGRKAIYIPFDIAVPKKAVLDIRNCILCGQCERVCPTGAINFLDTPKQYKVKTHSIIIATGFKLFNPLMKPEFKYGQFRNVITSMQMERLLSPTSPYGGILKPHDGGEPMKIAYFLCAGSRDLKLNYPLCSQVCCMYSIKQAQLILGALPLADVYIFYIDIRAFGKGYEEFYQQAKAMGVNFIKGQPSLFDEKEDGTIVVTYWDSNDNTFKVDEFDLVVLSVGLWPNGEIAKVFKNVKLETDEYGWIKVADPNRNPVKTSVEGVFVAGTASGPKDIPETIIEANAAAAQAASYILKYQKQG